MTNKVFTLVGEGVADVETDSSELIDLKDQLLQAGVKAGSVGELNEEQDIIGAQLMDLITPSLVLSIVTSGILINLTQSKQLLTFMHKVNEMIM